METKTLDNRQDANLFHQSKPNSTGYLTNLCIYIMLILHNKRYPNSEFSIA